MLEVKNLKYSLNEDSFDCEVNHPVHGWIPYTAAKNDSVEFSVNLYNDIVNGVYGEPEKVVIPVKEESLV